MTDQAVVKYFPIPYVSENFEGGFQRFKDTLQCTFQISKEAVEKSITKEFAKKNKQIVRGDKD